jgi:replicative DNA helicase
MCIQGGWRAVTFVTARITPDHFYLKRHRAIFDNLLNLWSTQTEITWQSVALHLDDLNFSEVFNDENQGKMKAYVYTISGAYAFEETQAAFFCDVLDVQFQYRRLQEVAARILQQSNQGEIHPDDIKASTVESLLKSSATASQVGLMAKDVLGGGLRQEIYDQLLNPRSIPGLRTGISLIDDRLGGFERGRVYTAMAITGVAKSWWTYWLAWEMAKQGHRPILFSTEMGHREVMRRLTFMLAGLDALSFRNREATPDELGAIEDATYELEKLPIIVCNAGGMDVASLAMEVRRQQAMNGANMVFIDHIQGLRAKGLSMSQERELLNEVTAAIKAMSMGLDIPVHQISHVRRPPTGEITRPSLSDGHGSGSIERDSDAVCSLHPIDISSIGGQSNFASREQMEERRKKTGRIAIEVLWQKARMGGSPRAVYYLNQNMGGRWARVQEQD